MSIASALVIILACVALFLFATHKFSRQIEFRAGRRLKRWLSAAVATPLRGLGSGFLATVALQSSTAITVMLVGLVNARLISFAESLPIIFGANIGSAVTSQLIAWNALYLAPYLLLGGFLLERIPNRWERYGRPIFYFGLIFFSFLLISVVIEPLKSNPFLLSFLGSADNLLMTMIIGFVFTVIFQSSGLASGLAIVFVSQGILSLPQAVGIILGANIGTTSTALLASLFLDRAAKQTAVAHFLFNVIGVLIFLPFLTPFLAFVTALDGNIVRQVANVHLLFNIFSAIIFLIFMTPFAQLVKRLVK